jgi:hypothetical protein
LGFSPVPVGLYLLTRLLNVPIILTGLEALPVAFGNPEESGTGGFGETPDCP